MYHLHDSPVEDGDCATTLAHLDPFIRGENPGCDADAPQTCEVGDLSGKHGKIPTSDPFEATFNDPYATLKEGLGAFFGNRSLVLHFANKTRISCANFQLVTADDHGDGDGYYEEGGSGEESNGGGVGGGEEDEDDCDDAWDGNKPHNDDDDYGKPVPPTDDDDDVDDADSTAPPPAEEEEERPTVSAAAATGASLLGAFAALFFAL